MKTTVLQKNCPENATALGVIPSISDLIVHFGVKGFFSFPTFLNVFK